MDCSTARALLPYRRTPSELDADAADDLARHLAGCPACAAEAESDRAFDAGVAKAMLAVPVPADLKSRVLATVAREQGIVWRRRVLRYAGGAVAAALTLAIFFGAFNRTPKLDPGQFAVATDAQIGAAPDDVRAYFRDQGFSVPLPIEFDFRYARNYRLEEVSGKRAPCITFQNGPATADVFVVRETRIKDGFVPSETSGNKCSIEVRRSTEDPRYVFIIRYYNGATRDRFLLNDNVVAAA